MGLSWITCGCCLLIFVAGLDVKESETRQVKDLSGMWVFRADYSPSRNKGFDEKWFNDDLKHTGDVISMPVPSSFNDITTDASLRDFVGWVWYETKFFVDDSWFSKRVVLRFGSVHYNTIVWLNSQEIMTHSGGHLPFEQDVTKYLKPSYHNRLTVAVNNTLSPDTLPPGSIQYMTDSHRYPPGYFVQNLQMDFFNYAGIHRPVLLYTTPTDYIADITIKTKIDNNTGVVNFSIVTNSTVQQQPSPSITINILDENKKVVGSSNGASGIIKIEEVNLWWPWTMTNRSTAYLYTMEVSLVNNNGQTVDLYRQPFGVRTVNVTSNQLLINDKPFYCTGVNMHEDSHIRGKGLDLPLVARQFNLLRWLGVNCFRTSHYPYAEETMNEADRLGVVVIDECPGVGIKAWNVGNDKLLEHHKQVMKELVARDKNRPSVIMWSVANEPSSDAPGADRYFGDVIATTRALDDTRLVTFVASAPFATDKVGQFVDILCVNRYYSWYSDMGHTELVGLQLKYDLDSWNSKYKKPVIMSEYGADTIAGLHMLPAEAFTEDYQVQFLEAYHAVFDSLNYFAGEIVWNFADFATNQGTTRVVGNKKGLFTRERQPKAAAFIIRDRYSKLHKALPVHGLTGFYLNDIKSGQNH